MDKDKIVTINNIVCQKSGFDVTCMDDEIVMMDIDKGKYYGINSVGSRIWELIKKPLKVNEIIATLLSEYNIDTQSCEKSVIDFLNKLYNSEIITVE